MSTKAPSVAVREAVRVGEARKLALVAPPVNHTLMYMLYARDQ
jgi:hypothetical protein